MLSSLFFIFTASCRKKRRLSFLCRSLALHPISLSLLLREQRASGGQRGHLMKVRCAKRAESTHTLHLMYTHVRKPQPALQTNTSYWLLSVHWDEERKEESAARPRVVLHPFLRFLQNSMAQWYKKNKTVAAKLKITNHNNNGVNYSKTTQF